MRQRARVRAHGEMVRTAVGGEDGDGDESTRELVVEERAHDLRVITVDGAQPLCRARAVRVAYAILRERKDCALGSAQLNDPCPLHCQQVQPRWRVRGGKEVDGDAARKVRKSLAQAVLCE